MISNSYSACFFIDVWWCCMCNLGQPHASSPKTALSHKQNLPTIPHIHRLSIYWIVKCNSLIQLSTTIFFAAGFPIVQSTGSVDHLRKHFFQKHMQRNLRFPSGQCGESVIAYCGERFARGTPDFNINRREMIL